MDIPLNYLAIVATVVALIILGSLWFGPLFGKAYMKEVGVTPEQAAAFKKDPAAKKKMMKSYVLMALNSVFMTFAVAIVLVFLTSYLHFTPVVAGIKVAFLCWLGFVVPVSMGGVLWENKTWNWWRITSGYYLVALVLSGVILALWA